MKHNELKQALRQLTKVLNDPRIGPGQVDQLQRAKRELEIVAQSGKLDRDRVFKAVEVIATAMLEIVETNAF